VRSFPLAKFERRSPRRQLGLDIVHHDPERCLGTMIERSKTMPNLTGGLAAVEALRAEGVQVVFGLIGSAAMELFDGLYGSSDIRYVGVRDERSGTHMADGYARASGKAGVIIAGQNGPGATNLVTGLAQAKAAYSPVVALAGHLSSGHLYRDAFQEVDQEALVKPITKKVWTVPNTARVPEILQDGFRTAQSPRCGPVQINLPRDVLAGTADFESIQASNVSQMTAAPAGNAKCVESAAALLATAQRPLIIAGGGIKNTGAHQKVLKLAEAISAPVALSPGHGDALPFDHELNAGQVGPRGNPIASNLAKKADVILALGTRLGFNTTFYSYDNINPDAKIIHVELEATAIGRYFPATVGIWGDAGTVSSQLMTSVRDLSLNAEATNWAKQFIADRKAFLEARDNIPDSQSTAIQPASLFKALRDAAPRETMYTLDAGTLCLQATDALNFWDPPSLFTPLDYGLVGFSFACGLGVKLAKPERPVISLMGDGGFAMTMAELSTAVSNEINTVTVIMNNQCWGAEKAYQRDFFNGRYIGADLSNPPYDKVAEQFGAKGFRVERIEQLSAALDTALTCGKPAVIDVQVDPSALYSFRRDSFKHRQASSK